MPTNSANIYVLFVTFELNMTKMATRVSGADSGRELGIVHTSAPPPTLQFFLNLVVAMYLCEMAEVNERFL